MSAGKVAGREGTVQLSSVVEVSDDEKTTWIGTVVARDGTGVYEYLPASIRNFPDQQRLCGMLKDAGFRTVDYDNLTGGIVAIHVAVK